MMIAEIFYYQQTLYDEYKSCCFENCVRQALEYCGAKHAHFLMNSDMSFAIKYNDSDIGFDIVRANPQILLNKYSELLVYHDSNFSVSQVWNENIEKLAENKSVIITFVDVFYLPYDTNYRKENSLHCLILCGYDKADDSVYLIDYGERVQFKGSLPRSTFLEARNSINPAGKNLYSGVPINNRWVELKKSDLTSVDYTSLITDTFAKSMLYFENDNKGLSSVEKIIEIIADRTANLCEKDLCYFSMFLYLKFYEILKTKRLFSLYVKTIYDIYKFEEMKKLWLDLQQIVNDLRIVLNLFVKSHYSSDPVLLFKAIENIKAVAIHEHKIFEYINTISNYFNLGT